MSPRNRPTGTLAKYLTCPRCRGRGQGRGTLTGVRGRRPRILTSWGYEGEEAVLLILRCTACGEDRVPAFACAVTSSTARILDNLCLIPKVKGWRRPRAKMTPNGPAVRPPLPRGR